MSNFRLREKRSCFCWFFIIAHFLTLCYHWWQRKNSAVWKERRFLAKQMSLFIFVLFSGWSNFALIIMMSRPFFPKWDVLLFFTPRDSREIDKISKVGTKVVILIDWKCSKQCTHTMIKLMKLIDWRGDPSYFNFSMHNILCMYFVLEHQISVQTIENYIGAFCMNFWLILQNINWTYSKVCENMWMYVSLMLCRNIVFLLDWLARWKF